MANTESVPRAVASEALSIGLLIEPRSLPLAVLIRRRVTRLIDMPIKTLHITNAYHSASGGIRAFYRAMLEAANRRGRLARLVVPGERSEVDGVGRCARLYHVAARGAFRFE